ncbi:Electron transfer flavoprotein subunit alpha, mitochondrial [Coccomyxa sp. Obi]|nr:Electron transfer flavoprotein subunit alpha, mitochondrial [Coccomyxa sp. Obi]
MLRFQWRARHFFLQSKSLHSDIATVTTLVLAEHKGDKLGADTLSTITAAKALGGEISVLLTGQNVLPAAKHASALQGIGQVLTADDAAFEKGTAERLAALLVAVQKRRSFTHIAAPSSSFGRDLLPRAAALLDAQPASDVTEVIDADTFVRPIYAGNAMQTFRFPAEGPRLFTVRSSAFPAVPEEASSSAQIEEVSQEELAAAKEVDTGSEWVGQDVSTSERPELGSAKVVISGGRALKSAENFQMLYDLADQLGGAVGASRAAVDAGFCPNDMQVGQTGKVVAPDLYIAVGVSGAIQHLAGMKDSKCIVAINTDPDCPIFQVADYGLVMDLFEAIPALGKEIQKHAK